MKRAELLILLCTCVLIITAVILVAVYILGVPVEYLGDIITLLVLSVGIVFVCGIIILIRAGTCDKIQNSEGDGSSENK